MNPADDRLVAAVKRAVEARIPPDEVDQFVGKPASLNTVTRSGDREAVAFVDFTPDGAGSIPPIHSYDKLAFWVRPVPSDNPRIIGIVWDNRGTGVVFFAQMLDR